MEAYYFNGILIPQSRPNIDLNYRGIYTMEKRIKTRMNIVNGVNSLLLTRDIDKIRVIDVCEASGVSRATFYRYFYDIIDVAYWLWDELNTESLYRMGNPLGWREAHIRQFKGIAEYRVFFARAFGTRGYISICDYGGQKILKALTHNITNVKGYNMNEKEKFELEYFVCGCSHMFAKWVHDGMIQSPEEMAEFFGRFIPPFLKKICGE